MTNNRAIQDLGGKLLPQSSLTEARYHWLYEKAIDVVKKGPFIHMRLSMQWLIQRIKRLWLSFQDERRPSS